MLYVVTFLAFIAAIGLMAIGALAGKPVVKFGCRGAEPCGCRPADNRKETD